MSENKAIQDQSLLKFLEKNKPDGRRNKLMPFKEHILFLKQQGYSDSSIARFLKEEKGVQTTQQSVNNFINKNQKVEYKEETLVSQTQQSTRNTAQSGQIQKNISTVKPLKAGNDRNFEMVKISDEEVKDLLS